MPISQSLSIKLMQIVTDCGNNFVKLLPELEKELTEDEFKAIRREIGRVIAVMDSSISAKIAADYPELAPEAVPIAHKLV